MEKCCKCESDVKTTIRGDEEKKDIEHRLNRIRGQVDGVKKMVDNDAYCDDILIQLSAIDKSIKSLANLILDRHLHTCIVDNIKKGNYEILDEISNLFRRFQ
ncbi:MAG: metal-sensing transcriptional repressor [Mollicutes bacterium]|nr:metal-sensing transcriptional repressor [Mollicutes bacterium]MDD7264245.1 metal-sensing transcriptional repressor [bacterium]MDY4980068.1 metal-sensing transcriptional repressor [Candidatus Onthovivens sp.]